MYRFAWQTPGGDFAQAPRPVQALPQPSAYEQLKTRYVNGEIGDEQYERELDALLKTPEGRGQIS